MGPGVQIPPSPPASFIDVNTPRIARSLAHPRGDNARPVIEGGEVAGSPPRVGTTYSETCRRFGMAVHPHARGDNGSRTAHQCLACGTPPRAWGQQPIGRAPSTIWRFTPTRVGTTFIFAFHGTYLPVHPHARGDNKSPIRSVDVSDGSPPRAWGQPTFSHTEKKSLRFTPTRVGTTTSHRGIASSSTGSPPRAWGQLEEYELFAFPDRFTPTRVGTTATRQETNHGIPVHPHARGDNFSFFCCP